MFKRLAGPGITALLGLGFGLTGWQVAWLGYVFLGVAALWALVLVTYPVFVRGVSGEVRKQLNIEAGVETPRETGELRVAVAQISEELEYACPILKEREDSFFGGGGTLPMHSYDTHGTILARSGEMGAHRAVREAYHQIDAVNRNLGYEQVGHDEWVPRIDHARATEALPVIERALEELHEIRLTE